MALLITYNLKQTTMGINMLEGSEMGALTESRLGTKCFVDDTNYNNFSIGKGKNARKFGWESLIVPLAFTQALGITNFSTLTNKQKQERAENMAKSIEATWKIDATKISDCDYLTTRLSQLQNTIISESEINASDKVAQKRILEPLKKMEVQYKNAISQAKCEETRTKAEADASKKETLDLLTSATATPPTSASDEKSSKTTKYIMYGVGGLILILGVLVVLKKK
jgi:hypothetical protein